MSDRLQELTVFVRTAESGSFSRTARELGLSQPTVSRVVATLEQRLGTALLLRTTRRVTPTQAGAVFLERARQILADLADAEDAARSQPELRGTLRVAMPSTIGTRIIIPRLPPFLRAHPRLRLELMLSDVRQDLVAEGAELAIRLSIGPLDDSGFGARKLASSSAVVVATPAYLAQRGTPRTLDDLEAQDCILGPATTRWRFGSRAVKVSGRIALSSAHGVYAATLAGLGLAVLSAWQCEADLASGALVRVLADHELEPFHIWAITPSRRSASARVRALVDHLARVWPE